MGKRNRDEMSSHEKWARLRFSVVGPLLTAPPKKGELEDEIVRLAGKSWIHPITEKPKTFGASTIERWLSRARRAKDPVAALRRRVRKDRGRLRAMTDAYQQLLHQQYVDYPTWTYQLHADNLAALGKEKPELGKAPGYKTVTRYLQSKGLMRLRRRRARDAERPGVLAAEARLALRETRSYEMDHVNALWHADGHVGSLRVLTPGGEWATPHLIAFIDDRSRLIGHAQWYLAETAENVTHCFTQAAQKRDLPAAVMTDNGAAETAGEVKEGFCSLGITHETTLEYSPHQNAKMEVFWAAVESQVMAMLQNYPDLTLSLLNEATLAWIENHYHRERHRETGQLPLERWLAGPLIARLCPSSEVLRLAFCLQETRTQRKSDGTVSIEGVRYELPGRFRHLQRVQVRYARWNLSQVHLVDPVNPRTVLSRLYPVDKAKNADGRRRSFGPIAGVTPPELPAAPRPGIAPLLRQLIAQARQSGAPPAYLPKDEAVPAPKTDDNDPENNGGTTP